MMSDTPAPIAFQGHDDPQALARALAADVARALRAGVDGAGAAALAVSGGRTPVRFFEALAYEALPWSRISVTLVDERWVPESSSRSNAALVRRHLLQGPAEAACFVPLFTGDSSPQGGLARAQARLAALPQPFAAVVLGMGEDGHTASFFPGARNLDQMLDPDGSALLAAVDAPDAQEPRLTLTLPPLLAARTLALHIEGAAKRVVLCTARAPGSIAELPIRAVLRHAARPLDVFWCP